MILSASYKQTSIEETKSSFVVGKVKEIVCRYDEDAEVILFGSRARGDWHEESDWDFLVLSKFNEKSEIKDKIRLAVLEEVEHETFDSVFVLFHNKHIWETKYAVTPLFYNIEEEGIAV